MLGQPRHVFKTPRPAAGFPQQQSALGHGRAAALLQQSNLQPRASAPCLRWHFNSGFHFRGSPVVCQIALTSRLPADWCEVNVIKPRWNIRPISLMQSAIAEPQDATRWCTRIYWGREEGRARGGDDSSSLSFLSSSSLHPSWTRAFSLYLSSSIF